MSPSIERQRDKLEEQLRECRERLAALPPPAERQAGLPAKAREVIAGHRDKDGECRECAMTWPCHAWLLADEILHPRTDERQAQDERLDVDGLLAELSESPLPGARYAYEVVRRRLGLRAQDEGEPERHPKL